MLTIAAPVMSDEATDIRSILDYLGIAQSSDEAQQITGLSKSALSEILNGKRERDSQRRAHIAVVGAIVARLSEGREAATGSSVRGKSAVGWLHAGRVRTSEGVVSPLRVLSDPALAREALDELYR